VDTIITITNSMVVQIYINRIFSNRTIKLILIIATNKIRKIKAKFHMLNHKSNSKTFKKFINNLNKTQDKIRKVKISKISSNRI
jgi:hypothetical protein